MLLVASTHHSTATPKRRTVRPWMVAAVVCCVVICGGGYFVGKRTAVQKRYQAWQQEQKLFVALRTEVSVGQPLPQGPTLGAALAALTRQTGIPYYLDKSCRQEGIGPDTMLELDETITGEYRETLESAQSQLLQSTIRGTSRSLFITATNGKLVLHASDNSDFPQPQQFQRLYPIPAIQPEAAIRDGAVLVELVRRTIDPYSWDDVGGPAYIQEVPGGVLIRNTAEVHAEVERLLSRLASLENPPRDIRPIYLSPYGFTPSENKIIATLDNVADFDYIEVPLKEVVEDISRRFDVPVYLATRQLEEAAVNLDTPVTVDMPQVSLGAFFRTFCRDLNLEYSIRAGRVRIGPSQDQCGYQLALYPVGDLLGSDQQQDMKLLREAILRSVFPESWLQWDDEVELLPVANGWFLVRHGREVHADLQEFLTLLRSHIPAARPTPPRPKTREEVVRSNIAQRLQQNFSPLASETPLKEFCENVKSAHNIPVLLDAKRLEEAAINFETPVVTHPSIQPLGRQLDATLAKVGLVYRIWNESLLITTPDQHQFTKEIFDVRDLTTPGSGLMSELAFQSLIAEAVPNPWEGTGPGTACWYRGRLIVGNYDHYQADVRSLLGFLRENRSKLPRLEDVQANRVPVLVDFLAPDASRWERAYFKFVSNPVLLKPEELPEPPPRRPRWRGGGGYF